MNLFRLAKITTSAERRNMTHLYKRLTVLQLTETFPKIDWKKYLSIVLDKKLTMNEIVLIYAWDYIQVIIFFIHQYVPYLFKRLTILRIGLGNAFRANRIQNDIKLSFMEIRKAPSKQFR